MCVNHLGPAKVRKLERLTGLEIDRAVIWSHCDSGRWADCRVLRPGRAHEHWSVDRWTGERELVPCDRWSSCRALQDAGVLV